MYKPLLLIIAALLLVSCKEKNQYYFWQHPRELEKVLALCPGVHPEKTTCSELQNIAASMQTFAWHIRMDPQGFGKAILDLQQEINQQEIQMKQSPDEKGLLSALNKNKKQLQQRLVMVKHLQAPGG